MLEPSWRKLSKDVLDGLDERTLKVAEGEVEGPGVFTDAGANMSRRENVESVNMDLVVNL